MLHEISVIIIVHNGEAYILDAMNSVAQQHYPVKELIIVDDGSKDTTRNLVRCFSAPSLKVSYIFQEHAGVTIARNRGLSACSTEFLTFLDHDDLYLPTTLAAAMKCFQLNQDLGVVRGQLKFFFEKMDLNAYDRFLKLQFSTGQIAPTLGTAVFKRTIFHELGFFDESLKTSEDIDLWLRIAKANIKVHEVEEVFLFYRRHAANFSKTAEFSQHQKKDLFKILRRNIL